MDGKLAQNLLFFECSLFLTGDFSTVASEGDNWSTNNQGKRPRAIVIEGWQPQTTVPFLRSYHNTLDLCVCVQIQQLVAISYLVGGGEGAPNCEIPVRPLIPPNPPGAVLERLTYYTHSLHDWTTNTLGEHLYCTWVLLRLRALPGWRDNPWMPAERPELWMSKI